MIKEKILLTGTKWNVAEVYTCDQAGNMRRQLSMDNYQTIVFNDEKSLTIIDNRTTSAHDTLHYTLNYDKKLILLENNTVYEIMEDADDKMMIHLNSKNDQYEYFYIWHRV